MGVGDRGRGSFFIILRYLKQLLLSKPCAILYLLKDRVANPTPLNKYFKKNFLEIFFLGGGEGVGVILFIPRTVSKHKVQLLPSKVCAILYLLKERVANPHPLNKFSQNIIKIILFISRTVSKHKIQLLPCKVCAILYLSKDRVANPHPRTWLNSKLPN